MGEKNGEMFESGERGINIWECGTLKMRGECKGITVR